MVTRILNNESIKAARKPNIDTRMQNTFEFDYGVNTTTSTLSYPEQQHEPINRITM